MSTEKKPGKTTKGGRTLLPILVVSAVLALGGVGLALRFGSGGDTPKRPDATIQMQQTQAAPDTGPAAPTEAEGTMATNPNTTTQTYGGWSVVCNDSGDGQKPICTANYRVINTQTNSNILVWLIGRNAEGALLSEFLTLTDLLIQPGVVVTLEGAAPVKAEFVECMTNSCKARLEMTPEFVQQLKTAEKVTLDLVRLDGKVVQFGMDIRGADKALADLGV